MRSRNSSGNEKKLVVSLSHAAAGTALEDVAAIEMRENVWLHRNDDQQVGATKQRDNGNAELKVSCSELKSRHS